MDRARRSFTKRDTGLGFRQKLHMEIEWSYANSPRVLSRAEGARGDPASRWGGSLGPCEVRHHLDQHREGGNTKKGLREVLDLEEKLGVTLYAAPRQHR